jgi:hypothetical protein
LIACVTLSVSCSSTEAGERGVGAPFDSRGPSNAPSPAIADALASLSIDDRPASVGIYRREDWPHWYDIDGDGCDAREQALIAHSSSRAQVDPFGCKVLAGDWSSPYDGTESSQPSDLDVDHVVSLENAFESGGWGWTAEQRRRFANDPSNLAVVSASSNRAKGSSSVDEWRPPRREAWCATATQIAAVKAVYQLTITTTERDALQQMLATC